ncbi:MAG: hypothetical protein HKM04_01430 [Legionellales bacterium]|nr:hypothetical protein [Legionellales bacterium]
MHLPFKKFIQVTLSILGFGFFGTSYASTAGQFLALADLHFNPFSYCVTDQPCPMIKELQLANPSGSASSKNSWLSIFNQAASQPISALGSDTNEALLNLTLNYIETLPIDYDCITINGDFIAHHFSSQFAQFSGLDTNSPNYQEKYQSFVRKTFQYIQYRLHLALPSKSIYITLGNNDSYDDDYVYSPDQNHADNFYHEMSAIWSPLIFDDQNQRNFESAFGNAGYYAITVPENQPDSPNRILFLNTNLYSAENNQGAGTRVPLAAEQQLAWLKTQLKQIRKNHGHAILIYHIPNGADNYASASANSAVMLWGEKNDHAYNDEFSDIVQQYHNVITSMMTAHYHMDGFQLMHEKHNARSEVLDTFVNGISPKNQSNPGFKLYRYDPSTLNLTDFKTYYLNIAEDEVNNVWREEYDFNRVYQPTCEFSNNCNLLTGYEKINSDSNSERTHRYIALYSASSGNQPINEGAWMPFYWCATQYQLESAYRACLISQGRIN